MPTENNPAMIYLAPACNENSGDGRDWCADDVFETCECGSEPVRYVIGSDFDRVAAEREALQQRLNATDQRVDELEGLLQETISAWAATQFGDPPTELAKVIARIKPALNHTPKPQPQGDADQLMKIAADLANRKQLSRLYMLCDEQKQVSTARLHDMLDFAGDLLAGVALDIRRAITKPQGEPVAWQMRRKTDRHGSQWTPWKECCDMDLAMHSAEAGKFNRFGILREFRPLYDSPPAPVAMVLPARKTAEEYYTRLGNCNSARLAADEFNSALDEVARLNHGAKS
ncbi:hypothetical protein F2A37_16690 [Pseudomonas chlororaphis]|uniref:hypothetical protein n=1 Tax=Pseudomonas chlororaphis TaxID=587753 RepID=UPI0012323601|nr:hypothetical protein [Pseudomonas chlororaphis]KAA5842302.1 hypothetical protein F2A37_16690 [Pseudomonas chlororaphis]